MQIGEILARQATSSQSTDSPQPVAKLPTERVQTLLAKEMTELTAADCRELLDWAMTQPTKAKPSTDEEFAKHFEYMATMPSRADDIETGRIRFAIYRRMLGQYSNEALKFMSYRVFERHTFFPSVAQCLEILREYRDPPTAHDTISIICRQSSEYRFASWLEAVKAGADDLIDTAPDLWKRIAECRDVLRRDGDKYVLRKKNRPQLAGR
jgi:hypothetical protein